MGNVTPQLDSPAIELVGVHKRYGNRVAVVNLTLTVPRGEIFAFLGPNGAGKTTTIKMIAGLLRPHAGTVRVCGGEMNMNGAPVKARMSYVPDQPYLYDKLTGREFLDFVSQMYDLAPARRDAALADLAAPLGMNEFLDRLTETYSHGLKQKVVLAAALMHNPEVLVIDEPMVGLDPRTARAVKNLFRQRTRDGMTVFMSTHTLEVAEAIADRIGIFNLGQLVALGTLDELRALASREHSLEDIFLRLTEMSDETVA
ncbi:MAG: ABC transporter ATP-binding protein [Phycisphaerales bacterium]|nr:ABC transporter ATP-binding protein [Phycisphaerales bacterium]